MAADQSLTVERFPAPLRHRLHVLAALLSTPEERVTMRDLIIRGCQMVATHEEAHLARITAREAADATHSSP